MDDDRERFNEGDLGEAEGVRHGEAVDGRDVQIVLEEARGGDGAVEGEGVAMVVVIGEAIFTVAAGNGWFNGDALAEFQVGYVFAEGGDFPGWFVTQDAGEWSLDVADAAVLIPVQVTAANTDGGDLDGDFAGGWIRG